MQPEFTNKRENYSVSAILTAHAEGALSAVSYNSLLDACRYAESNGVAVHKMVVLDRPTEHTQRVFNDIDSDITILETDFGDQGLVRNLAAQNAPGDLIAFIDGDDLWGENWLYKAWELVRETGISTIAHPEFNWFFQGVSSVLVNLDQEDELFAEDFLRFGNYWDAMCMAHRSVYLDNPYCQRRIKDGFAFEDWHWNCRTYEEGCIHRVVADTVHFKRRRLNSQTIEASSTKALMPETGLTDYLFRSPPTLSHDQAAPSSPH